MENAPANIVFEKDYPTSFINNVITGNKTEYKIILFKKLFFLCFLIDLIF